MVTICLLPMNEGKKRLTQWNPLHDTNDANHADEVLQHPNPNTGACSGLAPSLTTKGTKPGMD